MCSVESKTQRNFYVKTITTVRTAASNENLSSTESFTSVNFNSEVLAKYRLEITKPTYNLGLAMQC